MIGLFYKEFLLGDLSFDTIKNEFVYNSRVQNEEKAKEKYFYMEFYNLFNSSNKRSEVVFKEFSELVGALDREDIIELAKIKKEDSLIEKLEKLANLELIEEGFYIKNI